MNWVHIIGRRCISSPVQVTPLVALSYSYVPDILQKRDQPYNGSEKSLRNLHLDFIQPFAADGRVLLGGAFEPASDGALIVLRMTQEEAEEFARHDPYVKSGAVSEWNVKPWNVVIRSPEFEYSLPKE